MKFYRIDYTDRNAGHLVDWAGSKKEAKKIIAEILREDRKQAIRMAKKDDIIYQSLDHNPIHYRTVDSESFRISKELIPVDKKQLLIWLRFNIDTANG
jgi:hypothetical protein